MLRASSGAKRAMPAASALRIGRRLELAAALEDEPVERVEAAQLHILVEILAAGGEDLAQDPGVEEEGGADIEAVAARRADGARPPADRLAALEHHHVEAGAGEKQGGGQAAWAGADDRDSGPLPARRGGGVPCTGRKSEQDGPCLRG